MLLQNSILDLREVCRCALLNKKCSPLQLISAIGVTLSSVNEQGASEASLESTVTLHVILLGVGGTSYNQYTITPLLNLGIPMHRVHQLATKLHCHAIKRSLNKIKKTSHKIHFNNNNNSDYGGSGRGVTGRATGFRRARRRPDRMADNPPDPH